MTQALLISLLTLLVAAAPPPPTQTPNRATHALGPGAEAALRRALDLATPLSTGAHLNASVEGTKVRLTSGDPPVIAVTLVHAADAPPGAADGRRVAGIVLLPTPGPAPARLVGELVTRLEAAGADALPWIAPPPEPADATADPTARPAGDANTVDALRDRLVVARYAIDTDELARALVLLAALPDDVAPPAAVEIAILWTLAGDSKQALAVLDRAGDLQAPLNATVALLRGQPAPPLDPDHLCDYAQVAHHAHLLGHLDKAVELAATVRERAPDCVDAWEAHLQLLVHASRGQEAEALVNAAIERFPDDDRVLSAAAAAFQATDQLAKAVPLLERVTRRRLEERNSLRVLLGAMIRDVPNRALYRQALAEQIANDPDDVLSRFLAGVLHHYASEFEASNALLVPLEERLDHEDRIHIYRAMNDFNLGHTKAALERLDRAALRPDPDPDVFYCRAEILRDTNREQARDDLRRYAAFSSDNVLSNRLKEARIQRLLDLLDACIVDGRAECEGEWEHPRLRFAGQQDDETRRAVGGVLLGLILLVGVVTLLRRRRRAGQA